MLRFPQRILIAYDQCGPHLFAELDETVVGIRSQHKANIALCEIGCDIGNTVGKKSIVPEIGMRIERHGSEKHHYGLTEGVCGINRDIESGIIHAALRSLHPVNSAGAVRIYRAIAAYRDSGIRA